MQPDAQIGALTYAARHRVLVRGRRDSETGAGHHAFTMRPDYARRGPPRHSEIVGVDHDPACHHASPLINRGPIIFVMATGSLRHAVVASRNFGFRGLRNGISFAFTRKSL